MNVTAHYGRFKYVLVMCKLILDQKEVAGNGVLRSAGV